MAAIANVNLTDTFDAWRIRSNQAFSRLNQFAVNESTLYANTIVANVNFIASSFKSSGNTILQSAFNANGQTIMLDADQDSTLSAGVDDIVKFTIAGNDRLILKGANVGFHATPTEKFHVYLDAVTDEAVIENSNSGASAAPLFTLYRNSATPAGTDLLGQMNFRGKNNAAVVKDYASLIGEIVDQSAGTEDGKIVVKALSSGSTTEILDFGGDGLTLSSGKGVRFGANVEIKQTSANTASWYSGGTEVVTINSSKNVGIGQTSPTQKLHISGGNIAIDTGQHIRWDADTRIDGAADEISFVANGATKVQILSQSIKATANVVPGTDSTYDLGASGNEWQTLYADNVYGTLGTAAQPNITSVGTLTALTVNGTTSMTGGSTSLGTTWVTKSANCSQYTVTTSGSVTLDFETYQNFYLTLSGAVTLANPTTERTGQSGLIVFKQDGTGSRTLSLGTDYETENGGGITLSTAASATDVVPYYIVGPGRILLAPVTQAYA
tara:strand:- start:1734 stop:3224 length:1491 start_codon:yes stop_codon:yes gene_type:complete